MVIYPALLLWEVAKRDRLRESSQAHQEFYLFLDSNAYRGILIGSAAVYTGIAVEFIGFVGFVITVGHSPIANAYRVLSIAGLCVWFSGFLLDYFAAKSAARRAQALLADAPKRLAKPLGVNTSLSVLVSTGIFHRLMVTFNIGSLALRVSELPSRLVQLTNEDLSNLLALENRFVAGAVLTTIGMSGLLRLGGPAVTLFLVLIAVVGFGISCLAASVELRLLRSIRDRRKSPRGTS